MKFLCRVTVSTNDASYKLRTLRKPDQFSETVFETVLESENILNVSLLFITMLTQFDVKLSDIKYYSIFTE